MNDRPDWYDDLTPEGEALDWAERYRGVCAERDAAVARAEAAEAEAQRLREELDTTRRKLNGTMKGKKDYERQLKNVKRSQGRMSKEMAGLRAEAQRLREGIERIERNPWQDLNYGAPLEARLLAEGWNQCRDRVRALLAEQPAGET